ncbi:unnamed protein product [Tenebrio molitor]|nr:unnamed protein product [Tenebrio molitor]
MKLLFIAVFVAVVTAIEGASRYEYDLPQTDEEPTVGKRFLITAFANLFRGRPKEPIVVNQPPPPPPVVVPPPPPPPPPPSPYWPSAYGYGGYGYGY